MSKTILIKKLIITFFMTSVMTACVTTPQADNQTESPIGESLETPKTALVAETEKKVQPKGQNEPLIGIASYYGGKFHGRRTANGETFNKNAYTAAHKTLPFGGYWLVTNLRNGRQVIVRINDRGPYIKGRIIDLSQRAAKEIGMLHSGISKVKLEPIQVDKKGYITSKNAATIYQLAKRQKLPLKLKQKTKK